ncbi:MAG: DUF814 domain-containing protein [Bacteroidetes bacterium]|nr:MAG: DUF814 domain-containing protein [Bacteroidota bacterium]
MIRHYFTLTKLAEEIQFLKGHINEGCFTQEKNSLVMMLYKEGNEHYLCYSGDQKTGGIFLRNEFSRARKNTINLFDVLNGGEVTEINILKNERIIQLTFIDLKMNFILFGGAKSNIVITNKEGIIIDSFKNKKKLINSTFKIENSHLKKFSEFPFETTILKSLSDCDLLLGKYYAAELCSRLNINPLANLKELNYEIENLTDKSVNFKNECLASKEFYILENDIGERLLSLIPLRAYTRIIRSFNSINEAIRYKITSTYKESSFASEYKKIKAVLEKQKQKLQRNLEQLSDSNKIYERIENYKLWAESLQTLKNHKERVGSSIEVARWDGAKIIVPLNQKLTIRENIDAYFQKIKDSKEDDKIRQKRIPLIQNKLDYIKSAAEKLDLCSNIKEIEIFKTEYKNLLKTTMDELQTKEERFRSFELGDGYFLYVGKNAANNDELTMHFAKPNDLWLHARGAGGSHAVLRMKAKVEKPPKIILQKAAEIAAYYSQQRKGKFVPVAYTQKKYVHKPKGANPGSVVISKEQVIMVEPKLPAE